MSHTIITAQQVDGWRAVCADCDWRYENTSPSITRRAAEQHMASTEPAPAAHEVRRAGGKMLPGMED